MRLFRKSEIAPKGVVQKKDFLLVGDKYVKNYLVTRFPADYGLGLLSFYLNNPKIKIYLKSELYKGDYQKFLKREYRLIEEEWRKTTDPTLKQRYEQNLISYNKMIAGIIQGNDRVLDVKMVFSITATSKEELKNLSDDLKSFAEMQGLMITHIPFIQEELFKMASPLWIKSGLDKELEKNYGVPMTSLNFSGMWAYNYPKLIDEKGMLLGREKNNYGIIKLDPYLYKNDKALAFANKRSNGNMTIFGSSGSGKTATAGKIFRHFIRERFNIISFDPEDKNYYLTKAHGGEFVSFGTGESMINVFDLKPIASEEDENDDNMWDTEQAIYNAIDTFKAVLRIYDKDLLNNVFNEIDEIAIKMYKNKGITFDKEFRHLENNEFPILDDFNNQLLEELDKLDIDDPTYSRIKDLQNAITPMCISHKHYFNGHTTIVANKEKGHILSFGTKKLKSKEKNLRNALLHLLFQYIWSAAIDNTYPTATIFDEGHEYLLEGRSAKELSSIWRRSRKYNNIAVLITQEPGDLTSEVMIDDVAASVYGKAILNNSTYKIVMMLEKDAVTTLSNALSLNENEISEIRDFVTGEALLVVGRDRYLVSILATEKELDSIDPTRNN